MKIEKIRRNWIVTLENGQKKTFSAFIQALIYTEAKKAR